MTPESSENMRNACHSLAAQVMHTSARTNRCKWLRETVFELLKNPEFTEEMTLKYDKEYPYADVQSAYLVDVLKAYDEEVE